jgi:biotin-(acetyl-CoA carboxylase) ligase
MTAKGEVAIQWLTAAGALAMARAASDAASSGACTPSCGQADVLIEWPNDLVAVEGSRGENGGPSPCEAWGAGPHALEARPAGAIRKLGGVLVEGPHDAGLLVMGVGLNVDTRADEFPPEVAGSAGSLLTAFGATPDRREILGGFLRELEARLANVKGLPAEFRDRSATIGREVTVELDGRPRRARATGFDEGMRLVVELPGGRVAAIASAGLVEATAYPAAGPVRGGATA